MVARKVDVIEKVAVLGNTTKGEAREMFDLVMDALEDIVVNDLQGVRLNKLGTIKLTERSAREYPHPNNPEKVTYKPARKTITFTANKTTKETVEDKTSVV